MHASTNQHAWHNSSSSWHNSLSQSARISSARLLFFLVSIQYIVQCIQSIQFEGRQNNCSFALSWFEGDYILSALTPPQRSKRCFHSGRGLCNWPDLTEGWIEEDQEVCIFYAYVKRGLLVCQNVAKKRLLHHFLGYLVPVIRRYFTVNCCQDKKEIKNLIWQVSK